MTSAAVLLSAATLASSLSGAPVEAGLREALASDASSNYEEVVEYDLSVRLFPSERELSGEGVVKWRNTTSFPVRDLCWHLYLNAFRNDRSTFMLESAGGKLRGDVFERGKWGLIDVTKIEVDGTSLLGGLTFEHPDDDNEDDRTVMRTVLPREIGPGASIEIRIAFGARLPRVFARSGYGGDFFMVGQWFPKLGVLETVEGRGVRWNCHQYHATSEFFADYGRFRVAITVPRGYEVGATGERVRTIEGEEGTFTFVHEQDRVHDFAFTADRRFLRRERDFVASREVSPDETSEVAKLLGMFPGDLHLGDVKVTLLLQPEHTHVEERYFRAAFAGLKWFGLWYGAYPYRVLTIVDGPRVASGAMGMEYPTLITGGARWPAPAGMASPEGVTVHEFGHQYWYGLVGSNEFEEAWLDEGFNTYSTGKVLDRAYGPFSTAPTVFDLPLTPWFSDVRVDQTTFHRIRTLLGAQNDAIVRPAWLFRTPLSYGVNSYPRTALTLAQLEREIGEETMARAMRLYHLRWRYRHPRTEDFIATVEEVAGRPMRDFFDRTIFSPGGIDYAVTELKSERIAVPAGVFDDRTTVTVEQAKEKQREIEASDAPGRYETVAYVERRGEIAHPVVLEVAFEDGTFERTSWDGLYRWARLRFLGGSRATSARLHPDRELLLDLSRANDSRTLERDARPGVTWGAHLLYLAETLLQLVGAIL